jgi:CTP:molybdopterin cytidylyltransferase MocA
MIAGIVLAAGEGARMGQPKALLETGTPGETFVARACGVLRAAGVDPVVVVTAPHLMEAVRGVVGRARVVENADPSRGQSSSLQIALTVLGTTSPDAVVLLPVDVPLVTVATVRTLLDVWRQLGPPVVRPTRGDVHGHPVVLGRSVLAELAALAPGQAANVVVRRHASAAGDIQIDDDGAFFDVDTAQDYRQAFGRLPRRAGVQ